MGYTVEKKTSTEAREMIKDFEHALLYRLSDVVLKNASDIAEGDLNECTEARFFGRNAELRYIGDMNSWILISDDGCEDMVIDECFKTVAKFKGTANEITIRKYLKTDSDGQCFVAATRLLSLK